MKKVIGVNGLKDIVTSLHGESGEASNQAYCSALDELQEILSQSKYNEFVNSL